MTKLQSMGHSIR